MSSRPTNFSRRSTSPFTLDLSSDEVQIESNYSEEMNFPYLRVLERRRRDQLEKLLLEKQYNQEIEAINSIIPKIILEYEDIDEQIKQLEELQFQTTLQKKQQRQNRKRKYELFQSKEQQKIDNSLPLDITGDDQEEQVNLSSQILSKSIEDHSCLSLNQSVIQEQETARPDFQILKQSSGRESPRNGIFWYGIKSNINDRRFITNQKEQRIKSIQQIYFGKTPFGIKKKQRTFGTSSIMVKNQINKSALYAQGYDILNSLKNNNKLIQQGNLQNQKISLKKCQVKKIQISSPKTCLLDESIHQRGNSIDIQLENINEALKNQNNQVKIRKIMKQQNFSSVQSPLANTAISYIDYQDQCINLQLKGPQFINGQHCESRQISVSQNRANKKLMNDTQNHQNCLNELSKDIKRFTSISQKRRSVMGNYPTSNLFSSDTNSTNPQTNDCSPITPNTKQTHISSQNQNLQSRFFCFSQQQSPVSRDKNTIKYHKQGSIISNGQSIQGNMQSFSAITSSTQPSSTIGVRQSIASSKMQQLPHILNSTISYNDGSEVGSLRNKTPQVRGNTSKNISGRRISIPKAQEPTLYSQLLRNAYNSQVPSGNKTPLKRQFQRPETSINFNQQHLNQSEYTTMIKGISPHKKQNYGIFINNCYLVNIQTPSAIQ